VRLKLDWALGDCEGASAARADKVDIGTALLMGTDEDT
jgi:hypothetical protein